MMNMQGGSGKDPKSPELKNERGNDEPKLVRIEYIDPILVRNSDPRCYKPSLREAVGWQIDEPENEYVILMSDKPRSYQPNEQLHPEVAFVIPKTAVLGVWDLTRQSLRSR